MINKVTKEDFISLIKDYHINNRSSIRNQITIMTGEFGMHEFHFNILGISMGIKSNPLKTSRNYGGHILDDINKVYFRWRANKIQYFIANLNNKILFIGKNLTEALEFHKNSLNGK